MIYFNPIEIFNKEILWTRGDLHNYTKFINYGIIVKFVYSPMVLVFLSRPTQCQKRFSSCAWKILINEVFIYCITSDLAKLCLLILIY